MLSGERIAIKYATEVLVKVAGFLVENDKLRRGECPIQLGKGGTRYLIHTHPQHPSGRPFFQVTTLPNGLYLERHGSKQEVIRLSYQLLERYGYPPTTLQLIGFDD